MDDKMSLLQSIVTKAFNKATLIGRNELAGKTIHLQLQLHDDSFKNYVPGQQIKIFTGKKGLGDITRTYSIWNYDEIKNQAHLAVCTFSGGPGAQWATGTAVGSPVYFTTPKGNFTADASAENYIFAGDMSALAHLYELARHAGPQKNITGLVYAENREHFFADITAATPFGFLQKKEDIIESMVSEILWNAVPQENTLVYIAGETLFCQQLNHYFRKTLGWNPRQVKTKPFWHPGKKGMD